MTAIELDDPGALFAMPRDAYRLRRCLVCGGSLAYALPAEPEHGVITYVLQRQGWVKIGRTTQLRTRLRVLRLNGPNGAGKVTAPDGMDWGEPLLLLRVLEGDHEHELHERFGGDHVAGEWFLPGPDLLAWIASTPPPVPS